MNDMNGVFEKIIKSFTPSLLLQGDEVFSKLSFSSKGEKVLSFPKPKSERWKYTYLRRTFPRVLKPIEFQPTTLGWGKDDKLLNPDAPGSGQYGDTQFWDFNTQYTKDIKVLSADADISIVAKGRKLLSPALFSPRLIIYIKDGQDVTIVERHSGKEAYWKNAVTQIVVGKNARLHHYRLFDESIDGVHTHFTHVKVARDATYDAFNFIHGAGFIRNQIHAEIEGENANCTLGGINLLSLAQHADTTITIEHKVPNCISNQNYKWVLNDTATGVFQGKVHVHQIAQNTNAYQLSNALTLSKGVEMITKPELEIYADDVKCSHGATTGMLDEDPLFYLQSRGIPKHEARALLIEAFCGEALEKIHVNKIRDELRDKVSQWLSKQTFTHWCMPWLTQQI